MDMFLIVYIAGVLALVFLYAVIMDEILKRGDLFAISIGLGIIIWPVIMPIYISFSLGYYAREWLNKRGSK